MEQAFCLATAATYCEALDEASVSVPGVRPIPTQGFLMFAPITKHCCLPKPKKLNGSPLHLKT